MVDATKMSSIHLAVVICWARFYSIEMGWLLVPLGFALVSTVFFFGVILTDLIRRTSGSGPRAWSARSAQMRMSPMFALAVLPADYGLLMIVFAVLWLPTAFIVIYTSLLAINALILVASLLRWYRSLPGETADA
jgi:hypothetical protein